MKRIAETDQEVSLSTARISRSLSAFDARILRAVRRHSSQPQDLPPRRRWQSRPGFNDSLQIGIAFELATWLATVFGKCLFFLRETRVVRFPSRPVSITADTRSSALSQLRTGAGILPARNTQGNCRP